MPQGGGGRDRASDLRREVVKAAERALLVSHARGELERACIAMAATIVRSGSVDVGTVMGLLPQVEAMRLLWLCLALGDALKLETTSL